ncbi:MAG: hypothetical protein ACRC6A_09340 [Fusobacteriaceae bacterium]
MKIVRKEIEINVEFKCSTVAFKYNDSKATLRYTDIKENGVRFTFGTLNVNGNIVNGLKLSIEEVKEIFETKEFLTKEIEEFVEATTTIETLYSQNKFIAMPAKFEVAKDIFEELANEFLAKNKFVRTYSDSEKVIYTKVKEEVVPTSEKTFVRTANSYDKETILENGIVLTLNKRTVEVEDADYGTMLKNEYFYETEAGGNKNGN